MALNEPETILGDKFHEECAVFGIYGHPEAANLTYLGLYALQHRGQEGSGIVACEGGQFHVEKGLGLVNDIFSEDRLRRLVGRTAVGHNRYSTAGGGGLKNVQPLVADYALGTLALAHNGNLINAQLLRAELEAYGAIFQSTSDTEVIIHLIAHSHGESLLGRVIEGLRQVRGAYSLILLSEAGLIAVRDPYGLRPLSLGRIQSTDGGNHAWIVASESCAFDLIEAEFIRDIEPGELVVITDNGPVSHFPFLPVQKAPCVFEYVYFARPDSQVFGREVYALRRRLGQQLAREAPIAADVVIAVPDSGVPAALGYADQAKIPYETGLVRNHYVGRTFIEPRQAIRHFGVKVKLNMIREVIAGRRVIVVDDSIVRGTTSRKIVKMIRQAGAAEVHMRISSPPIISPCYYGIDTPTKEELIGSSKTVDEICEYITADSLRYLSLEGMLQAVTDHRNPNFCTACFSDRYPIPLSAEESSQLGLFE
jgi:amidophosphoribosyltransferase